MPNGGRYRNSARTQYPRGYHLAMPRLVNVLSRQGRRASGIVPIGATAAE